MQFPTTPLTLIALMAFSAHALAVNKVFNETATPITPSEALPTPCVPGAYWCSENQDSILVCDTSRVWELSATCGHAGCCNPATPISLVPYCYC